MEKGYQYSSSSDLNAIGIASSVLNQILPNSTLIFDVMESLKTAIDCTSPGKFTIPSGAKYSSLFVSLLDANQLVGVYFWDYAWSNKVESNIVILINNLCINVRINSLTITTEFSSFTSTTKLYNPLQTQIK